MAIEQYLEEHDLEIAGEAIAYEPGDELIQEPALILQPNGSYNLVDLAFDGLVIRTIWTEYGVLEADIIGDE